MSRRTTDASPRSRSRRTVACTHVYTRIRSGRPPTSRRLTIATGHIVRLGVRQNDVGSQARSVPQRVSAGVPSSISSAVAVYASGCSVRRCTCAEAGVGAERAVASPRSTGQGARDGGPIARGARLTELPRSRHPARLTDSIPTNLEPILVEWVAVATSRGRSRVMDTDALHDHAKNMLTVIVAELRSAQSQRARSEKCRPEQLGTDTAARKRELPRCRPGADAEALREPTLGTRWRADGARRRPHRAEASRPREVTALSGAAGPACAQEDER